MEHCPRCDGGFVSWATRIERFTYGNKKVMSWEEEVECSVRVYKCDLCEFMWTDSEADDARDKACKHLQEKLEVELWKIRDIEESENDHGGS